MADNVAAPVLEDDIDMDMDMDMDMDDSSFELYEKSGKEKIYCANCINCKLVKTPTGNGNQYQLRVRCSAGKWKKKLGEEKFYKYFTVARRSLDSCDSYEPMGEVKDFIRDLKKTLPIKDEVYSQ